MAALEIEGIEVVEVVEVLGTEVPVIEFVISVPCLLGGSATSPLASLLGSP
jgi:hypothetical protein